MKLNNSEENVKRIDYDRKINAEKIKEFKVRDREKRKADRKQKKGAKKIKYDE